MIHCSSFNQEHAMQVRLRRFAVGSVAACATSLACVLAVVSARAQPGAAPHPSAAGLPPIIDRELFFGDPEIAGSQLSPDGRFISFLKPFKGTRNIWVKRTEEAFDSAKPITADAKRPISTYFWSRDGRFILYAQDS